MSLRRQQIDDLIRSLNTCERGCRISLCVSPRSIGACLQEYVDGVGASGQVQELVSLNHGVSLVPAMARERDTSNRRIYRSLSGTRPMRTIVMVTKPYRFQSRVQKKFQNLIHETKTKSRKQD